MHLRCFIVGKKVTIHPLLVCKTFGPEIWLCKTFDKSHVCPGGRRPRTGPYPKFSNPFLSHLQDSLSIQTITSPQGDRSCAKAQRAFANKF